MCIYNEKDYKFSVDWLTVRIDTDIDTFLSCFCESYNLDFYKDISVRKNGLYLYPYGYYLSELGANIISFSYNKSDDGHHIATKDDINGNVANYGVLINITGDGCRWLNSRDSFGLLPLIDIITRYSYNVTRLDIACDILDKDNDVVPLAQEYGLNFYNLDVKDRIGMANGFSSKDCVKVDYVWDDLLSQYTPNITIGNRSSCKGQMQVYNKRVEVEKGRLSSIKEAFFEAYDVQDYWYRIEYRCKSFANYIFKNYVASHCNAGVAFTCAAIRFGRFTLPVYGKSGLKDVDEWVEFLEFLESIHFVQLDTEGNIIGEYKPVPSDVLPYVPCDVDRVLSYVESHPKFMYKLFQLKKELPDYFASVYERGRFACLSDKDELSWNKDFASKFPVMFTLPDMVQCSFFD